MTGRQDIDRVVAELEQLAVRLETGDVGGDPTAVEALRTAIEHVSAAAAAADADANTEAAAAADEARAEYEELFGLAPDAFFITDLAGVVEDANAGAADLFGVERRFLIGKPLAVFVARPARPLFRNALRHAAQGHRPAPAEYRFERRGGILFDGDVRVSIVFDRDGERRRLHWIVRDVTEQKQLEAQLWELNAELERLVDERAAEATKASRELFEKRAQFEAVLRQLPLGVLVVGPAGDIVSRNARAEELFGGRLEHIREIESRFLDEDGRPFAGGVWPGWSGDRAPAQPSVVTFVRTDDSHVLLEARIAAVATDGMQSATAFVFDDVTAQQQRDIAQRAFIANAAHELRTPLAAIVSAIEVLQGGAKEDVASRDVFLAHIQRESDRLVRLARALLLLARAQAMEEQPKAELVPLRPLLEEIVEGASPAPRVALEIECADDVAAWTSPELLRQAVASLFDNALRHTSEGMICLRGRLIDDLTAAVEIEDTGVGMSEREKEVAQHRFVRGSNSGGFGLGLAIAAEAARAAGGELALDSAPGRGTTATITVRAAQLVTV